MLLLFARSFVEGCVRATGALAGRTDQIVPNFHPEVACRGHWRATFWAEGCQGWYSCLRCCRLQAGTVVLDEQRMGRRLELDQIFSLHVSVAPSRDDRCTTFNLLGGDSTLSQSLRMASGCPARTHAHKFHLDVTTKKRRGYHIVVIVCHLLLVQIVQGLKLVPRAQSRILLQRLEVILFVDKSCSFSRMHG